MLRIANPIAVFLNAMTVDRRTSVLLAISVLVSAAYCSALFDLPFLLGTSPFWRDPHGVFDCLFADMSTALSGYDYFVRDHWRLPLFQTSHLGAPSGSNIIYTDSTPIVALVGRMLFELTGRLINPFGVWTALCFAGSAAAMVLLVAVRGGRSLAAGLVATVFGLCAPTLLQRWGHTTLMAQGEVTLALAFYFWSKRAPAPQRRLLLAIPLCLLAAWTHAYLLAMVLIVVLAAIGQAALDRRTSPLTAAALTGALVASLTIAMALSGYFAAVGGLAASGFGGYTTNLLSPFYPQGGLIGTALGFPRLDMTGGQDEGACYLGAGAMLLLLCSASSLIQRWRASLRRHACLTVALAVCGVFACSNIVFFGRFCVLALPLPAGLSQLAGVFRASGRFIWPISYLLLALVVASVDTEPRRGRGLALLLAAASLQLADTAPLRAAVAATTRTSVGIIIDTASWEAAVRRHDRLQVNPAFGCALHRPPSLNRALTALQLIAARNDVPTNSVYAARGIYDCPNDLPPPEPDALTLYWRGGRSWPKLEAAHCAITPDVAVCSGSLDAAALHALLPRGRVAGD